MTQGNLHHIAKRLLMLYKVGFKINPATFLEVGKGAVGEKTWRRPLRKFETSGRKERHTLLLLTV